MADDWILGALQEVPLFAGLAPQQLQQIAKIATCMDLKPGQTVVHQGRQSQRLWVVLQGECEVLLAIEGDKNSQEPVKLATLDPYNAFGGMSFFQETPHSASVRTKTEARLLKIERADFDTLLRQESTTAYKVAVNLIGILSYRLRRMDGWVADLLTDSRPVQRVPEWNQLREKLFDNWTL